jgi:hypothetical protein
MTQWVCIRIHAHIASKWNDWKDGFSFPGKKKKGAVASAPEAAN